MTIEIRKIHLVQFNFLQCNISPANANTYTAKSVHVLIFIKPSDQTHLEVEDHLSVFDHLSLGFDKLLAGDA